MPSRLVNLVKYVKNIIKPNSDGPNSPQNGYPIGPTMHRAKTIGNEVLQQYPGHNNMGDAMRHAEWSRRMQMELGTLPATVAGYGHELKNALDHARQGNWPPLSEALMDIHNNAEGRRAARENRAIQIQRLKTLDENGNYR